MYYFSPKVFSFFFFLGIVHSVSLQKTANCLVILMPQHSLSVSEHASCLSCTIFQCIFGVENKLEILQEPGKITGLLNSQILEICVTDTVPVFTHTLSQTQTT